MTFHHIRAIRSASFTAAVVLALASPVAAQSEGRRSPVPHQQVISANPFLLIFEWFNAEYERKINESITWGVSGSTVSIDETHYRNGTALFRYYPQGAALTGFYLGGRAGAHHVSEYSDSHNYFGLGIDLGYTWLLGGPRRFALSLGFGVTRLFGDELDDGPLVIPNVRLVNIGVAF